MPRLLPEAPALSARVPAWFLRAAAGAALASFAGLMGRWCAGAAIGWALAAACAGLGVLIGATLPAPAGDDDVFRLWALAGALATLAIPAILRFLGLALADAGRLTAPLGGTRRAAFVLVQACLPAALAAAAWTRAGRERRGGRPSVPAALAGAAICIAAARAVEPAVLLAASGLALLVAIEIEERAWSRLESAPLRSRAFAAAAVAGLLLFSQAPGLLRDVWMARLHAAYPGGGYLSYSDDGLHAWAAYRFSNGDSVLLRDGVPQTEDPETWTRALSELKNARAVRAVLVANAPAPAAALAAVDAAGAAIVADATSARAAALDALGGRNWRALVVDPAPGQKPEAALLFLPRPPRRVEMRRLTGAWALGRLKRRLAEAPSLVVVVPEPAPPGTVDALVARAGRVFGSARAVGVAKATLVIAAPPPSGN